MKKERNKERKSTAGTLKIKIHAHRKKKKQRKCP
jgi:hypothetical protein